TGQDVLRGRDGAGAAGLGRRGGRGLDRPRPPARSAPPPRGRCAPGEHRHLGAEHPAHSAGRLPARRAEPGQGDHRGHLRRVAAQDAALARAGQAPTSIFTGYYGEAGVLDVLGTAGHLPPVLSGNNNYWIWGPGQASNRIVLVVDALGWLRPYFTHCRVLTTY